MRQWFCHKRIVFIPISIEDTEEANQIHSQIIEHRNASNNMKCFYSSVPFTLERHLEFCKKVDKDPSQFYSGIYAIVDPYNNVIKPTFIGAVSICNIDWEKKEGEYGRLIFCNPDFLGHGYVHDVDQAIIKLAFEQLGLTSMRSEIFTENTKAIYVHTKNGWKDSHVLKQHVLKDKKYKDVLVQRISIYD